MQSIRIVRRKYEGYTANPSRDEKQEAKRHSADSQAQTLNNLDDEEKGKKEEEIRKKRKEADPYYVTWEGDDDPMNPQNWSTIKKWTVLSILLIVTFFPTFSSSVFSSDTEIVASLYGFSAEVSQLGTALYLVGLGFGPLLFGPMSEAFGRSPVYFGTFLAYLLFQLGPAIGNTPQTIFICRFFAGFFGSSPLSNAGGSLNDMFNPVERALAFPFFAAMPFLGPVFGPVVAGACTVSGTSMLNGTVNWRWVYIFTLIFGGAFFLFMLIFLPETQQAAVLALKARGIRRQTGDNNYYCDVDKRPESNFKLIITAMPKPVKLLFTEPIILVMSLYLLVIYTILYMDFEGYAFLFSNETYQFNLTQVGLAFIAIGVGVVLCGATAPLQHWDYKRIFQRQTKDGEQPMASPESRLRPLMIGGFFVPIGVFWLAWTARPGVYWAAPVVAGVPFGLGLLFVFLAAYQYLIDCYGPLAASALASATLFRYVGAGGLVMVVRPMYKNLAYTVAGQQVYAWPLSLLGFLSIACLPFPFVLYFGGGMWLRKRSPVCVKF